MSMSAHMLHDDALTEFFRLYYRDPLSTRLILSSVCRRWRRVALNDGMLWRTVRVTAGVLRHGALQTLLERSKDTCLHVYMDIDPDLWRNWADVDVFDQAMIPFLVAIRTM